ncbi:MAG: hypothetical protein EXR72_03750 [Myxococcales bacterium]|nr:hypothetical protein [Myxococcales bacterium]
MASGRKVDSELRAILGWGITEPGGANAKKGLPTSFLAGALLSTQKDVGALLAESLAGDSADSGKNRLAEALQALAQDPLFKKLLDRVRARYDRAFSEGGGKRTAKDSIFKVASEGVRRAREERDEAQRLVDDSASVEGGLSDLAAQRDAGEERVRAAAEARATVERLREEARAHEVAMRAVAAARSEVDAIDRLAADVAQLEGAIPRHDRERERLRAAVESAEAAPAIAEAHLREREEAARGDGAGGGASEAVERLRIERGLEGAQRRLDDATRTPGEVARVRSLVDAVAAAEKEGTAAHTRAKKAATAAARAAAEERGSREALAELEHLERLLEKRAAEAAVATAQARVDRAAALLVAIAAAEDRTGDLRARRAKIAVPDRKILSKIRKLEGDLGIARGKLEVGLQVTVDPVIPRDVSIGLDGGAARAEHVSELLRVSARGAVELILHGVATVRAEAGSAEAREHLRSLEARWGDEAMPVLVAAEVATAEGLAARIDEAEGLLRDALASEAEAARLRGDRAGFADAEGERAKAAVALVAAARAIGDGEARDAEIAALGSEPRAALRARRATLTRQVDESKAPGLDKEAAVKRVEAATAGREQAAAVAAREGARRAGRG